MARKQSSAVLWGVVLAIVLLCVGFIAYTLTRPSRLVPVLRDVDGKQGNRKYSFSIKYYWLTQDSLLVSRTEDNLYLRFDLRTKAGSLLKAFPDPIIGISPDGRYLIGIKPDTQKGNVPTGSHTHLIAVAVDGTETLVWNKARDVFQLPPVRWTRDGKYGFFQKRALSSNGQPTTSKLFRVSMSDFESQPVEVVRGQYNWIGADDRNRLLAWDEYETNKRGQQGTVRFRWFDDLNSSSLYIDGAASHLAVVAFPLNSMAKPIAPNKPERFLLRLPPGTNRSVSFTLSPDGKKVAWMSQGIDPLPPWLFWLPPRLYYSWKPSRLQFWVSDLSDEAIQKDSPPRLVFAMDWDRARRKPVPLNSGSVPVPHALSWSPDSKHLTFLDDNTLWRLSLP